MSPGEHFAEQGQHGGSAMLIAPTANATTPTPISALLDRSRSASAPAGVCAMIPAIPPPVSTTPMVCSFHMAAAR